jgi:AsmA protein
MTFSAQGQLLLDKAANVAEWTGIKISANQLRALGELKANDLDKTPQISGGISIAQFDLAKFVDSIGQTLPAMGEGSLSKVELVSRVAATPTSLSFDNINLKLDDSSFSGRIAIEDFAKQSLRAILKADTFNVDRYLPPKSAQANSATQTRQAEVASTEAGAVAGTTPLPDKPSKTAWSTERLLPVERLAKLDVDADLTFGQLTLDKLPIQNAALKATGQGGLLTLTNLSGDLYNGGFVANGTLDVRPSAPVLNLQTRLNRVPAEKIIESQGKNPPVKGLVTLTSSLTGSGNSQQALIDTLNGNASFVINNGVLLNANLEQQLCKGIATLNRKSLSGEPRGKDTPFEELKGNLTVRNGVASNPDLKVRIPGMTVNGDGMDYRVGIIVEGDTSAMPDPACQVGEKFVGIEWPLRCRGPLEMGAKACRVDNDRLGQVASKMAGNKLSEKIDEKLGDKVSPELKDALKGLFKR